MPKNSNSFIDNCFMQKICCLDNNILLNPETVPELPLHINLL